MKLTGILSLLLIARSVLALPALSPEEARIAASIDEAQPQAIALLERLVNFNSGTLNPEGVRAIGAMLRPEFEKLGFTCRWIPMDDVHRAGHLVAERKGSHGKRILLIGHMDTVFEPASPFQKFVREPGSAIASGPGTSDMKGGLVILLYALKALHRLGALEGANLTVFLTGDEERPGEPFSIARRDLIAAGKQSDIALEFEGGTHTDGRDFATISRRSASLWTLRTSAKGGHSSGIFSENSGDGAIYELTRILDAFHNELREPGLTYNVGMMLGGTTVEYDAAKSGGSASGKSNIIPQSAVASGDIRTLTGEQLTQARERMSSIAAQHLPGASAAIEFRDGYPAMAPTDGNKQLLNKLNEVNRDLGKENMEIFDPSKRGAGDISFVAPYLDGLTGLGAMGSGAHAPGETIELDRMPLQMKRTALLLYRLSR